MMHCMRDAPHHHPRTRPPDVKESRLSLEPRFLFWLQCHQTFGGVFRVTLHEIRRVSGDGNGGAPTSIPSMVPNHKSSPMQH
jgi:hypothetical protein